MDETNRFAPVNPTVLAGDGSNAHCLLLSSELIQAVPLHFVVNPVDSSNLPYIITLLQHGIESQKNTQAINKIYSEKDNSEGSKQMQPTTSHTKTIVIDGKISKSEIKSAVNKLPQKPTMNTDVNPSTSKVLISLEENSEPEGKIVDYVHIPDTWAPPRAVVVLPAALRYGRGVVTARCSLPPRVRFGPVSGVNQKIYIAEADELISEATTSHRPIFLCRRENESVYYLDMTDKDRSNWFSLLPLGDQTTANVWLYEEKNNLYGITTNAIPPRIPLQLGYSKKYADTHHMPSVAPVLDLQEVLGSTSKTKQKLSSYAFLQRHAGVDFKDEKRLRQKYRCSHCRRTYSRLSTLKRHMARYCTKKIEKESTNLVTTIPQENKNQSNPVLFSTPLMDDSRVPSDESFQNYTNSLDFSTNLFDTDRMPNLDMSGSSRSEAEYNLCHVETHGDSSSNKAGKNENHGDGSSNKTGKKTEEKIFVFCAYCDQPVVKEKYKQHYRECPAQRLECKCGKVFHKKESLSEHIQKDHFDDIKPTVMKQESEDNETPYKCDECKHIFKRRGMLANHVWRIHNRRLPLQLERRVRHYPCPGCTNIYRTAAKRDTHAKKHHPGMEIYRIQPIEGERRRCEAAACPACPRQYATRAKLLQHARSRHPHLVLPGTLLENTPSKRKIKPELPQF